MREIAEARHPPDKARILAAHLRETTARSADIQTVIESAAATDAEQRTLRADLSIEHAATDCGGTRDPGPTAVWSASGAGVSMSSRTGCAETLYAQPMARPAGSRTH